MRTIFEISISFFWFAFLVYWVISAKKTKKNKKGLPWWQGVVFRIVMIGIALFLLNFPLPRQGLRVIMNNTIFQSPIVGIVGVVLCGIGITLAFWARVHIGRNWGQPMAIKEKPELITTGPYSYIRHPIYAGVILAVFGSALASSVIWFIPFTTACVYFLYSAKTEEKNMTKAFPKEYPAYMKRTKRLIPFLY